MPFKNKEDYNRYKRQYWKAQSDKNASKDELIEAFMKAFAQDMADEQCYREVIDERIAKGQTVDQAVGQLEQDITDPDEYQSEESKAVASVGVDSKVSPCAVVRDLSQVEHPPSDSTNLMGAPEVKKDCFGTRKAVSCHGDCNPECLHAYLEESFKDPRIKEAERKAKLFAVLEKHKDVMRKSELQALIQIGTAIQAAEEAKQKELDSLTKKYMAQDASLSESAARETAVYEQRRIQNVELMERLKAQAAWDLKTPEQQLDYKMKLIKDARKLRGESNSDHETRR